MRLLRNPRILVLVTMALVALALVGFSVMTAMGFGSAHRTNPNVVFLVIDTLRADHLGCYGYRRPVSPHIDALAKKSTRYPRSFSSAPWTLPSHASFFTGLFAYEHGSHTFLLKEPRVRTNKKGKKKKDYTDSYKLKNKYNTLAEFLSSKGYDTGAVVANVGYLGKRWNLHQGFDHYKVSHKRANVINDKAFAWIDSVKNNKFFLFINYMDTHRPYNTKPRPGLLKRPLDRDKGLLDKLKAEAMGSHNPPVYPAPLAGKVIDQYDTAISNVDEEIGRFVDFLKRRELYDNTLLIVTSDHGEYFGEHFLVEHSKDVYQEALHVPLLIKNVGQEDGKISRDVVSSVDIPGLIVQTLRGQAKDEGVRLFPRLPGNHPILAENYYSRSSDVGNRVWGKRFKRIRAALFYDVYKYILSSDGQNEMYNLRKDRKESKNLAGVQKNLARKLEKELTGYVKANWEKERPPPKMELSETEIEQMKKLGYMQ